MSTIGDLLKAIREVVLLTERVEKAAAAAEAANERSLENRERIVRIETILELAMARAGGPPRLPQ